MEAATQDTISRLERLANFPFDKYKNFITGELCALTNSSLSYFATVDQTKGTLTMIGWSTSAMINCMMLDKPLLYKISETGLWGDAVREGKAVITNDYKGLVKPTKKGYPEGHVQVRRHMNLPIFENSKVVLVIGVGNKVEPYTQDDAKKIEEVMNVLWKTIKAKL